LVSSSEALKLLTFEQGHEMPRKAVGTFEGPLKLNLLKFQIIYASSSSPHFAQHSAKVLTYDNLAA
jgi:hypothetical protein